jgi:zinc protease
MQRIKFIFTLIALIAIYLNVGATMPNDSLDSNQTLALDPSVRTGKLSNGFTYFIRKNTEPQKRVVMYLVNKVGSVLEDEDQRGLAHFMEHMSFNGTKHFPKNELVDYLQKAGVRFGSDLNAYTSYNETVYQLPIPSDKPELLQNGLQIMRDWAQDALLDGKEIDSERGVILEEKRLRNNAASRMQDIYFPVMLNNSIYSQRTPIGLENLLKTFPYDAIRRFYHDWYRPDLQAIIVVGDIDVDAIEQRIKTLFADLKMPDNPRPRPDYKVQLLDKNQFIIATDNETTQTSVEILYKFPEQDMKTLGGYHLSIIRNFVNQMFAARYQELAMQPEPPFVGCSASLGSLIGGLDVMSVNVVSKPGKLQQSFDEAMAEVERIKRFGFTQTELDRAKADFLSRMEQIFNEKDHTESDNYVNEYVQYFLKGIPAPGIEKELELCQHIIPAISIEECNALISNALQVKARDIVITAPEKEKPTLPDENMVNQWFTNIQNNKLSAYVDKSTDKPFFSYRPTPGKIVKRQTNSKLGTTTLTLSNGMKVVLKPTTFKNNEIQFTAFSEGGSSLYSDSDYMSVSQAASIVGQSGVDQYNSVELSKMLTGKSFSVSSFINDRYEGFKGSSTVPDFETAMQMLWLSFVHPRIDTTVFYSTLALAKAGLKTRSNNPMSVFSDTVNNVLSNYNFRRSPISEAKINQIKLDKVYSSYKERFANAADFTVVFTGSIDSSKIDSLVCRYLASLPANGKHEKARDLHIRIPNGNISKTVCSGNIDKSTVWMAFHGTFRYGQDNNMQLKALNEVLEIKLLQRLREIEGGVYSPSVSYSVSKYPENRYTFVISFGCAPINAEKLVQSTFDEIEKIKVEGPQQVDIEKFKAEEKNEFQTSLQTNDFWLNYLYSKLSIGENPEDVFLYEKRLNNVTVASVKETAKRYLNKSNFVKFVLLPENH